MNGIQEINVGDHPELNAQPGITWDTLYVRGDVDLVTTAISRRAVAVVGARASTPYGEEIALRFGRHLADRKRPVVTGAAYGIDGAALRGALGEDGPTIAVLAGGVDVPYPRAHEALIERVAKTGAVVSAYPPGSAPRRERFLERNGLIAALTTDVVVVEAGLRSGSLNAARQAYEQGRYVWAVPGPVTSVASSGCHNLIRTGMARIITDPEAL